MEVLQALSCCSYVDTRLSFSVVSVGAFNRRFVDNSSTFASVAERLLDAFCRQFASHACIPVHFGEHEGVQHARGCTAEVRVPSSSCVL